LPESLRDHVDAFFRMQLEWLTKIMREAVKAQEIASDRDPDRLAMLVFSTVEGGSLIAWAMDERGPVLSGFEDVVESVMDRPARRRSAADKARVSAPAKGRGR
jgi:TetR/AcrR family transcriptional repressor of nem operon